MTPHQILTVAVRLLAIVWFITVIANISGSFAWLDQLDGDPTRTKYIWLSAAMQAMACGLLWMFPATVAAKLLRGGTTPANVTPITPTEWQAMLVIGIGLWALTRVFPDVIYWTTFVTLGGSEGLAGGFSNEHRASIISTVAEVALGLWLVFGGPGFAAFLLRARTAGLRK